MREAVLAKRLFAAAGALACGIALAHLSLKAEGVGALFGTRRPLSGSLSAMGEKPAPSGLGHPAMPLEPISLSQALGKRFSNGMVISGATLNRLILFTFDDGPAEPSTPRLLDALDEVGIKAVFFLSAWRIRGDTPAQRAQAEVAIDIMRRGHIIGSHGLDHEQLPLLNSADAFEQIVGAQQVFEATFGDRPWLFRPPGGARSQRIDDMLAEHGYTTVLWNLGAGDVQVDTAEEVFATWKKVFDRREREDGHSGGIILLHDTHAWSVDGFRMIYAELMRRNCVYLARGEELYDIVDDPSFFYVPRGEGKPGRLAPPAAPTLELLEARQRRLRESTTHRCKTSTALAPEA